MSDEDIKSLKERRRALLKKLRPPKRANSAYACYSRSEYPHMKEELGSTATQPEIFSAIAKKWHELNDYEKQPYIIQADEDKERYMKEEEEYKKNRRKWEKNLMLLEEVPVNYNPNNNSISNNNNNSNNNNGVVGGNRCIFIYFFCFPFLLFISLFLLFLSFSLFIYIFIKNSK